MRLVNFRWREYARFSFLSFGLKSRLAEIKYSAVTAVCLHIDNTQTDPPWDSRLYYTYRKSKVNERETKVINSATEMEQDQNKQP